MQPPSHPPHPHMQSFSRFSVSLSPSLLPRTPTALFIPRSVSRSFSRPRRPFSRSRPRNGKCILGALLVHVHYYCTDAVYTMARSDTKERISHIQPCQPRGVEAKGGLSWRKEGSLMHIFSFSWKEEEDRPRLWAFSPFSFLLFWAGLRPLDEEGRGGGC